jgi:chromosomal replication initiator protein
MESEVEKAVSVVGAHYNVPPEMLVGRGRAITIAFPRQVVMFILWNGSSLTLQQIGDELGGRTPATISWGVQKIFETIRTNESVKGDIECIKREVKGQ